MNSKTGEKNRTMKNELPRSIGAPYATFGQKLYTVETRGEITAKRMKPLVQRGNDSVVDVTGW